MRQSQERRVTSEDPVTGFDQSRLQLPWHGLFISLSLGVFTVPKHVFSRTFQMHERDVGLLGDCYSGNHIGA